LHTLPPSPWKEFLQDLDDHLGEVCHLAIFGGFAVTQVYGVGRPTADIDVLEVTPLHAHRDLDRFGGRDSDLAIRHKVYLDIVGAGVANPPYEYDIRLRPIYAGAFKHLHLLVMDPYDVALTKLKRDSDKDIQDVLRLAAIIPFDLDLFEKRYLEELRDNTTGRAEDNDQIFYRWKTLILEDRSRLNDPINGQ
jgi:hypothetical protein